MSPAGLAGARRPLLRILLVARLAWRRLPLDAALLLNGWRPPAIEILAEWRVPASPVRQALIRRLNEVYPF
jgi:hypothetical protein